MFVGFAKEIKQTLSVPILCALQGEDIFLEDLIEPYRSQALKLLRGRASEVDGYIAPCQYYADFMAEYLDIPMDKIDVVHLGLNLSEHGVGQKCLAEVPFVIGFLARICPEKGLHLLVDAFYRLTNSVGSDKVRLKVAGYLGKKDEPYLEKLVKQIDAWGLSRAFDYWGEVDRHQKIGFLNGLHVLSVPTTYKESKGLFILEALANGVPVVQPRHGAFPELIAATGGGILVDAASPDAIAEGLSQLMSNRDYREQLGQQGKEAVHREFSDDVMAEATLAVYQRYINR